MTKFEFSQVYRLCVICCQPLDKIVPDALERQRGCSACWGRCGWVEHDPERARLIRPIPFREWGKVL